MDLLASVAGVAGLFFIAFLACHLPQTIGGTIETWFSLVGLGVASTGLLVCGGALRRRSLLLGDYRSGWSLLATTEASVIVMDHRGAIVRIEGDRLGSTSTIHAPLRSGTGECLLEIGSDARIELDAAARDVAGSSATRS